MIKIFKRMTRGNKIKFITAIIFVIILTILFCYETNTTIIPLVSSIGMAIIYDSIKDLYHAVKEKEKEIEQEEHKNED